MQRQAQPLIPYEERPRTEAANKPPQVSRFDLLGAFLKNGVIGLDGVVPYARRVIVEERQ